MFSGVHRPVSLHNFAGRSNRICDTPGRPIRGAAACPVGHANRPFGVTQQGIRKSLIFCELRICRNPVRTHTQNLYVLCRKVLDSRLESVSLNRSATGTGTRVKPHHNSLSQVIAQLHLCPGMVLHCKIRCNIPCFQHIYLLLTKNIKNRSRVRLSRGQYTKFTYPNPEPIAAKITVPFPGPSRSYASTGKYRWHLVKLLVRFVSLPGCLHPSLMRPVHHPLTESR